MADEFSEPSPYGLADLPAPGPPGDAAQSLSPFERAAIRQRRAVLRGRDAPDAHTSPATLASIAAGFAPGSGFVDAFGYMPDFKGGYEPSLVQNLKQGDYSAGGGQALGLIGDTLYLFPLAGATVGSVLKAARSGRRAARVGSSDLPNPRGRPSEEVFATYEAIPGTRTNHLPGLASADDAARVAYSNDPRSSWALAPRDRDAIYSGMRRPDTGQPMQVLPTVETQGLYQNPRGQVETNPGWAARPTLGPQSINAKSISDADRRVLEAVEATRGYIDAQNASAFHKPWLGGPAGTSNSLFIPQQGKVSAEQLRELRGVGVAHGLDDTVDVGKGVTITNFGRNSNPLDLSESFLPGEIRSVLPGAKPVEAKVESGLIDFAKWGDGAATEELLKYLNATPEIRTALSNNPHIPHKALNNLRRDEDFAEKYGATNEAIQNARRIIHAGPGWIDRLEEGLKNGAILPAVAAAILYPALHQQERREQGRQESRPREDQL